MKYKTGYCYWRLTFYFFFILHIICQFLVTWIIDGIIFHFLMASDGCLIYWNSFWNNCIQASLCVVFWWTIKFVFNSILFNQIGNLNMFIFMLKMNCKCTSLWLEVNKTYLESLINFLNCCRALFIPFFFIIFNWWGAIFVKKLLDFSIFLRRAGTTSTQYHINCTNIKN